MSLVTWLHSASELSLISIGSLPFLNVIDLQAKLKASVRVTRSRVPVEEDPLELRLGLGGNFLLINCACLCPPDVL